MTKTKNKSRPVKQAPIPCTVEEPCVVCSGMAHPCYRRGNEAWCGFIGTDEIEDFTPAGWGWIGTAPSGQQVFQLAALAQATEERRSKMPEESPPAAVEANGKLSADELETALTGFIVQNATQAQLEAVLPELAKKADRSSQDVWRLYRAKQAEIEQAESRSARKQELSSILTIGNYELRLTDYLCPTLAKPLEAIASYMGSNGAAMLTTLLPAAASLLKVGTRLELSAATDFYALPILYTGILAESGSAKSPTQKTILKPLFKLQAEADDTYNYQLEQYEAAREAAKQNKDKDSIPTKPFPREYYTVDSTREAIATIQSQQPERGFIGWFDELSGLIGGQNQYRNGRGTDKESILSGRDGTGLKVNRASGKRINTAHSAYSITGSTQPDTLRKLIGDFSDPSGQWARFLWATLPLKPAPFPENVPIWDIDDLLYGIYVRLENYLPQTYSLSKEARSLYAQWFNKLDARRMTEPQQGLRAVFSKMKGDTGVLALLLHCINAATLGEIPSPQVSVQTMASAIHLAGYYLNQVRLIHAEGDDSGSMEDTCNRIIKISQRKGWITARDVHAADRQIRKRLSTDAVRSIFRELEAMGMGEVSGEGVHLEFRHTPPKDSPVDTAVDDLLTPLTVEELTQHINQKSNSRAVSTASTKNGNGCQQPDISTIPAHEAVSTECQQNASTGASVDRKVSTASLNGKRSVDDTTPSADGPVDTLLTPVRSGNIHSHQGMQPNSSNFVDTVDTPQEGWNDISLT